MGSPKRARIEAALSGGRPDRVPVGFWQHTPTLDGDVMTFVRATVGSFERYDLDFIKLTPRMPTAILDWGVTLGTFHPHRGFYFASKRGVTEPDDWSALQRIAPDAGSQAQQLAALRATRAAAGPDVPILVTLFSPAMAASFVADDATFARHLREAPDRLRAGLTTITQTIADFATACVQAGADGFLYGIKHASARVLPWDEYAPLDAQFDRPLARALRDQTWFTIAHLHGQELAFDRFLDYPAHALNWYDRVDGPQLDRARAKKPDGIFAGGVDHERTLLIGTPDEVRFEVRDAIAQTGGRGFIVAPGCTAPVSAPDENIRAMREAVEESKR
jgi:uroporphyrinogen decarboxylase